MLLRTATHASIFVALAFPLTSFSTATSQNDVGTITTMASMPSASSTPLEATVEIQFDGLVGSGIIDLTSNFGFTVVNMTTARASCTSPNPFAANITSGATVLAPSTNTVIVTNPPWMNASNSPLTSLPLLSATGNGSLGPIQNTSLGLPSATGTSANISIFTGIGGRSRVSVTAMLIWIPLALIPTFFAWSDNF